MTEQTATARPRYIDTAEVTKLVRRHLKKAFPQYPAWFFSVRIDRYSGGSSIDVSWIDGPTTAEVEKITGPFQGARFDGMIDLQYNASQWYCPEHGARVAEIYGHGMGEDGPVRSRCCAKAELVNTGASWVHESRRLSPEFEARLEFLVRHEAGMPTVVRNGNETLPERSAYWHGDYSCVRDAVYRLSRETSA